MVFVISRQDHSPIRSEISQNYNFTFFSWKCFGHKQFSKVTLPFHEIFVDKIKNNFCDLTESFFNEDWSFLSSVVAVLWTTFFFLRAVPLPPMRTWACNCLSFSWFILKIWKNENFSVVSCFTELLPRARGVEEQSNSKFSGKMQWQINTKWSKQILTNKVEVLKSPNVDSISKIKLDLHENLRGEKLELALVCLANSG